MWYGRHRGLERPSERSGKTNHSLVDVALGAMVKSSLRRSEITRTVAGQLGVVSIATLGSRTARVLAGEEGRSAIAEAVGSRIMSAPWSSARDEAFGPLAFALADGQFVVILRDVVDRGTTEWVMSRMRTLIEPPVEVGEVMIDPAPVFGVAFGDVRHWAALLEASEMALEDARLASPGSIVVKNVGMDRVESPGRVDLIRVESGEAIGLEIVPAALDSMRQESALGIGRLESAVKSIADVAGMEILVSVGAEMMCRPDAGTRIVTLADEIRGASGELVVSVQPRIAAAGFGTAWRAAGALRRSGISVLLDLSSAGSAPSFDADIDFDGVIVDAGAAVAAHGPRSVRQHHLLHSVDPRMRVIARGAGPAHLAFMEPLGIRDALSTRLAWRTSRRPQTRIGATVQRSDRTIEVGRPAQLAQVPRSVSR